MEMMIDPPIVALTRIPLKVAYFMNDDLTSHIFVWPESHWKF